MLGLSQLITFLWVFFFFIPQWTRAATVRKYIQRQLGAENKFKGEQLWTTRHIMQWCRLYGQSPHQPGEFDED